jgi:inosine-uridine nucleoside N-ribohydrolase
VPCDVTVATWLKAEQVERLRDGDALCRALAQQIEIWSAHMRRMGRGVIPEDHVCLLHDPLAVACTVDRRFVTTMKARVTVAMQQGHVRTFIDPAAGHEAEIVTGVDAAGFADFWLDVVTRRS